jgi:hypothetical protein
VSPHGLRPVRATLPPPAEQIEANTNMVKMFPLVDDNTGNVRVVLINKMHWSDATVTLYVNRGWWGPASAVRLTAKDGLTATTGITLGGLYFPNNRLPLSGKLTPEDVPRRADNGRMAYDVYMPFASAAIVTMLKA